LGEATQARIAGVIATPSKTRNPIDIFPDWLAHGYEKTMSEILKALLDDKGVDGIVFISFADARPEVYQPMVDILKADRRKPVFLSLLGDSKDKEACQSFLDGNGLPCYDFPEYAVRVFAHMRQYARIKTLCFLPGLH
jgi:acyl-CoA synthetase (NDP forming)